MGVVCALRSTPGGGGAGALAAAAAAIWAARISLAPTMPRQSGTTSFLGRHDSLSKGRGPRQNEGRCRGTPLWAGRRREDRAAIGTEAPSPSTSRRMEARSEAAPSRTNLRVRIPRYQACHGGKKGPTAGGMRSRVLRACAGAEAAFK